MSHRQLFRPISLALITISIAPVVWGGPKERAAATRSNVLVITVESLRSDHLGCYTGGRKSTPAIDALAARGVRFIRAYTASPSTAPAVSTLLTGLYPVRHG